MRKIVIFALVCMLGILPLSSCGTTDTPSPSQGNPEISVPGEASPADSQTDLDHISAYVGTNIFEDSLDPIKGAMSYGYSFTNAALIKVDEKSEYIGDMATDWDISEDGLVYTFHLREGVKFSDGSEMKAQDVVFTYETVKSHQAENENVDLSKLSSVKAVDASTVEMTLSEPFSPFLDTTAMLGIVPADAYDRVAFDQNPIGTGPWKVVQYDANQQIIVEPNPYYYEGAPSISRVTLLYMDNDTALAAARSGQVDIVMVSPDYASEQIEGMHMIPLETMDIRMISLPVLPAQEREGVTVGNDVTADPAVRQALAIGIDRATIIEHAFNGIGKPAVGFTGNLLWASEDAYSDNRKQEAIALLEKAGWQDTDGDGIREKDGVVCTFDVYAAEDRFVLAAALAEDAKELGIQIVPHASGWDEIYQHTNTAGVVWGWGQYSPTVLSSLFDSKNVFSGSTDNVVGYQNEQVDTAIKQAMGATDQETARANWKEVQTLVREDIPYLYLVNIEHCYFVSDRVNISVDTQIPHPHGHGSPIICNMKDWTLQ